MAAGPIGFFDFARLAVDAIEAAGLEYLIGGSVAVWAWGEPRTLPNLHNLLTFS
jgi:hypothetical protein